MPTLYHRTTPQPKRPYFIFSSKYNKYLTIKSNSDQGKSDPESGAVAAAPAKGQEEMCQSGWVIKKFLTMLFVAIT